MTINGEVAGSEITMSLANGTNEKLISVTNTVLNVIGGKYSMYGTYASAAVAIRSENAETKINASKCVITVDASATTAVRGVQAKGITALHKCHFDVVNQSGGVAAVYCTSSLTMGNCYGSARSPFVGATVSAVYIGSGADVIVANCHLEADGYGDANGKTYGVWAINSINGSSVVINGGYYWGARDGVAILGTGRINGGVFEGCQYGGAYMGGSDIKVKNAIFHNVKYKGTVGLPETQDGAVYCGSGTNNAVIVHFDNCRFGASHPVPNGIVAKHSGTAVFLSNCVSDGIFTNDLSADNGNTIHVGKNVQYNTTYGEGTIDTTIYADQEFGFETEATTSHALLSVKDERGNWVGIT